MKSYLMVTTDTKEEDLEFPMSEFDLTPSLAYTRYILNGWTKKAIAYYYNTNERHINSLLKDFRGQNKYSYRKRNVENLNKALKEKSVKGHTFKIISDYKGEYEEIEVECTCGYKNKTTMNSISTQFNYFNGRLPCPTLGNYGEYLIKEYLEDKNYCFNREQRFKDLKVERMLRFDFSIIENGKIKYLIEHDGKYHNRKGDQGEQTRKHDNLKNKYCKENNIPLLRIDNYKNIGKQIREFEKINF